MCSILGCNINFGCDSLIQFCCTPSGLPVRKNINDLRNDLPRLVAAKADLMRRIQASHGMRPLQQVNEWLSRAETLEANAEKLINDYTQVSTMNSFRGLFPKNCITRCDLWQQIPPMYRDVTDHLQRLPTVVFEEAPIALSQKLTIEPTIGMELMLDDVWSYIQDEQEAGMIGLHGMGGVGKTTLLKAVFNKLCSSTNFFDLQLFIVVSKTPNLVDIQNDIGKNIGLLGAEWISKRLDEKASDILSILEKKTYILLLDDIWERFDLVKIGIPLPNLTNKSKVIFTTRLKQVCGLMKANKQIQVKCLNEAEAWELFKENVGEEALNAHRDVPDLAKDVMKECSGLPLALIVIGRAMTCKTTIHEWKHAIDALKENAAKLSASIHDEVFARLKYSYDNLLDNSLRSCFLYCSLYPEDEVISKEELIDKWLCEDFLVQSNDLHKDRRQGYVNISTLVKASLLEDGSNEMVKMHDVIRDMAIWIGGDCGEKQNKFFVKARADLTQVPYDAKWELAERLSLMNNNIDEPNAAPECPNLMTLFLGYANLRFINDGFFQFMPKLQVLDLSHNDFLSSLPKDIGKLVSLRYLNVSFTDVAELPEELKELIKLKYLNMKGTRISSIPEGVVSSLKKLRVFKCGDIFMHDDFNTLIELESLEYLNDVTIDITNEDGLLLLSSFISLRNHITNLSMQTFNDLRCLDLVFLKEMKNLDVLQIFYMRTVEKIVVGKHGMIINSLRCLSINGCHQLKDLSWLEFSPNIEEILVVSCYKMKTLAGESRWNDNTRAGGRPFIPLAKLTKLHLEDLPNLESIYPTNLFLPSFKDLRVFGCDKLEKLPFHCLTGCGIIIKGVKSWWHNLEWEDDDARIIFSSCFRASSDDHMLVR